MKPFILLAASLSFYYFNGLFGLFGLLTITFITYSFSLVYDGRKSAAIIAISLIASMFIFSKLLLGHQTYDVRIISLAAPLGLSFYSLQAISYIVDVCRKKVSPERNVFSLSIFLSFFPQASAGPIHRHQELTPQFHRVASVDFKNITTGFKMSLWGYFCKLIMADKLALVISPILDAPEKENGITLFIATLLYSFQIYFDFYGYTLIAIGVARMFGIRFADNFDNPYSVKSFKQFWRRWHITLSRWLRDYVYIPVGGRAKSFRRLAFSVIVTFLASALWHGVTLNFFIWGMLHALFYLGEDALSKYQWLDTFGKNPFIQLMQRGTFFILLSISWLIFRTVNLDHLRITLTKIVAFNQWKVSALNEFTNSIYVSFILLFFVVLITNANRWAKTFYSTEPSSINERSCELMYVTACLLLLLVFGDLGTREFLYFNF